jgi:hypothetical protein
VIKGGSHSLKHEAIHLSFTELRKSRTDRETNSPAMWSHPDLSETGKQRQNNGDEMYAKWKYLQINTFNTTISLVQMANNMSACSLSTKHAHPIQLCPIHDTLQLLPYIRSTKHVSRKLTSNLHFAASTLSVESSARNICSLSLIHFSKSSHSL